MGLVTGCSSKCESVCSEANACGLKARPTDVDCPAFCSDVDAFNERAKKAGRESCEAQFQAHLSCWETSTAQLCAEGFTGCEESGAAWTGCMAAHCEAVAEEGGTDPNCFDEDPALYPF
jgi:hypothetical protein